MSSEIVVNGIQYVPSKEAAAKVGLVADYISRMCREKLVDGKLVGSLWYVNEASLREFLARQKQEEVLRRASQAQLLKEERRRADRRARGTARLRRVPQAVLLATTVAMLLGTAALSLTTPITNSSPALAAVASAFPAPLRASLDRVATSVYNFVCPYFSDCNAHSTLVRATPGTAGLSLTQHPATTSATAQPAPQQLPTRTTPTISQSPAQTVINQPIIERVRETVRTIVQGGVNEAFLDTRLAALEKSLTSRVDDVALAGAYQTNRTYDVLADALRIEELTDLILHNPVIDGGSITAASITGTLSNAISSAAATIASLTATELVATNATTTNLDVSGTATIGSGTGVLQSTSGIVSAITNGSVGQVLKIVAGVPQWGTDLTGGGGGGSSAWATTSDDLALYAADPADVVLIGAAATTTSGNILEVAGASLLRGALTAYQTVTAPTFTATSSSATSTFPRLNVTSSLGIGSDYLTDITGSGLSISSGALTLDTSGDWSGTLGGYNSSQLIALGFSTSSADAWKANRNFFATSSADYFVTQRDLFSTTSANYLLAATDKGFFFSTTSADAWKLTRNFFATSSADYWKSVTDLFSTTSATYFVDASTTIPKTYSATTFTALQTFGNASTSILSATSLCLSTDCRTAWPSAGSSFGYLFPNDATTTTLTFNGGLLSVGSTTINGNATTTGMLGVGSLFIGNSRFTSLLGSGLTNLGGSLTLDTSGNWTGTFDGLEGAAYLANSFSTTSADVWKSNRNFFATTSADYWRSQTDLFATTSSDFWLTQKTTDNLTQGASNKYYSTLLFASDLAATTTDAMAQGATNKYWSNTLFDNRLSATTSLPNITTLTNLSLPASQLSNFGVPFYSFFSATNTNALAEGSTNKYFTDARADARINATSSIGTLTSAPNLGTIATSLSGFLKATAGVLTTAFIDLASDVTGILAVTRGGTGWANIASAAIPYGNGTSALATTTAGTPGQVLALLNGVPTWAATTTLSTITGTLDVSKGGTGLSATPTFGQILRGTGAGFALVATSTLGIDLGDTTGTLSATRGGTGISNPSAAGILLGSYSGGSWQQLATSSLGLLTTNVAEGANLYYQDARVQSFIHASTTIPKTYSANTFSALQTFANASTTNLSATYASSTSGFFGSLSIGSLTGFLRATAGAITTAAIDLASDVTGILGVNRGGTGWANIASAAIPYGNGSSALATTTAGTPGQVLALLGGVPTWVATTTFSSGLTYSGGNVTLDTSGNWTGTFDGLEGSAYLSNSFSTTSADTWKANRDFFATTSADFWKTTRNFFSTTSTDYWKSVTDLFSTSSAIYFAHSSTTIPKTYSALTLGALNGPLHANAGVLSATTSIGVLYGGTGLVQAPTYGQILVGNSSGGYTLTATSSLGLPTFAYPFPNDATSTTLTFSNGLLSLASTTIGDGTQAGGLTINGGATTTGALIVQGTGTSTFAAGLQATALNVTSTSASSTFANGINLSGGCFSILGVCLGAGSSSQWTNSGSDIYYSTGNVGIGTTTPWAQLSINPNGVSGPAFAIGSSTATSFIVTNGGRVGIGLTTPSYPLDVLGDINFTGTLREDGNEIFASMIAPFAGSCPTGWSEYTAARGRTVVGTPSGGTNAGTVGSALTDLGTRTITDVASHLHAVDPPSTNTSTDGAHTHGAVLTTQTGSGGKASGTNAGVAGSTGSSGSHSHSVDIASFNSGSTGVASVDVTMPYIQLTYCQKAAGADIAEWIPASEDIEKATIISTDPENHERVVASRKEYDNSVVGVVATKPGWLLGQETKDSVQMALAGRVPMRVSLKNGEIKIGDPITTSSIPGVGMKATKAGPIVGKAMEAVNETSALTACTDPLTGRAEKCATALVFVNISWYSPTQDQSEDIALQFASTYTEPLSIGADFETGDIAALEYRYPPKQGDSAQTEKTGYLMPASAQGYAVGVISTEIAGPGNLLRRKRENNKIVEELRIIESGKAEMNISPSSHAIQVGDPIAVAPNDAGRGSKAETAGFIIARALEAWQPNEGKGAISVMMDSAWWAPPLGEYIGADEQDEGLFGNLVRWLIAWLADTGNGIAKIVTHVLAADRVETKQLCVGSTCVTEAQFMSVFSSTAAPTLPESVTSPASNIREGAPPESVSSTTTPDVASSTPEALPPETDSDSPLAEEVSSSVMSDAANDNAPASADQPDITEPANDNPPPADSASTSQASGF